MSNDRLKRAVRRLHLRFFTNYRVSFYVMRHGVIANLASVHPSMRGCMLEHLVHVGKKGDVLNTSKFLDQGTALPFQLPHGLTNGSRPCLLHLLGPGYIQDLHGRT
jgi:hypothetical protein